MKKYFTTLLLAPLSILLLFLPLLTSCSSWFKLKTMTIEYDEEVKLHDGSMIWVHITRHYFLAGELAHGSNYMPSSVEISWDTGFEGVGRRSVYFKSYVGIIDKYQDTWYVIGNKTQTSNEIKNSINCNDVGVFVERRCVVAIDKQGQFVHANPQTLHHINKKNILYPVGIKDWGFVPNPLNGTNLTWTQKKSFKSEQSERFFDIGKPLFSGEMK